MQCKQCAAGCHAYKHAMCISRAQRIVRAPDNSPSRRLALPTTQCEAFFFDFRAEKKYPQNSAKFLKQNKAEFDLFKAENSGHYQSCTFVFEVWNIFDENIILWENVQYILHDHKLF